MRPYLAIIRDSFQAALANRVLWIAFIAIWLVLGAILPLSYREDFTTKFHDWDFDNGTQLKAMLAQGIADPAQEKTALGRISRAMPDDLQRPLKRVAKGDEVRIRISLLSESLNKAVEDESWYDAEAWRQTPRLRELRELDEKPDDELTDALRRRRARLRIESALPGVFTGRSATSINLTYLGFDIPNLSFPIPKEQFDLIFNQFALPIIMNWMLGLALVFLGVLVTASVAPDMLQPGSLHLLLSKPISRSALLLSKYFGACSFVFICVCQLIIGLWLIAGLRFDIWNIRLLWCIPAVVFLFAVYYSVSFLAGLRWRTPILAIGLTVMFGSLLFVFSIIAGYFDGAVVQPEVIRSMALVGDDVLATTFNGSINRFDSAGNKWISITEKNPRQADLVLALRAIDEDHVVTARIRGGRRNPYGSGSLDILVLDRGTNWEPEPGMRLPIATRRLMLAGDDSLLAMNTGGLMQTSTSQVLESVAPVAEDSSEGNEDEKASETEPKQKEPASNWLTDLMRMRGGATDGFESILPVGVAIVQPARVVVSDNGQWLIVYSRGRISRLDRPKSGGGPWTLAANRELDGDATLRTVVAISGDKLLLARRDEPVQILNAATLETITQLELPSNASFYSVVGLRDDKRFAVVMTDGSCEVISVNESEATFERTLPFSGVETIGVDAESESILLAHGVDKVDVLDLSTLDSKRQIRPSLSDWRLFNHYVITPLRTITPQTGELGDTVSALVGGKTSMAIGQNPADDGVAIRFKILRPILSCAGFIVFMLCISCWYFSTRDF